MPTFDFKSPDGKTYSIQGPDGATQEQAFQILQQQLGGAPAAPPPDKYQQAAIDEQAALKTAGGAPGAGLTRRLAHGATLGADSTILAGLETPLEMIKRGTLNPAEGYSYAKAREDQIMNDARKNTGMLGTGAEMLGGAVTGGNLAGGVGSIMRGTAGNLVTRAAPALSTGSLLAPGAGIAARTGASAADAAAFGGFSGAMEGNGLQERITNALKSAGTGAAVGAGLPVVGKILGAAVSPITSNIRALLNPVGYGNSQVARGIHDAGISAQAIDDAVQQAAREGQGVFNVADAMGDAGQNMLGAAARGPGTARTAIVNALEGRQGTQGRRISNALAEGFQAPETAAQTEAALKAARTTAADAEYGAVRNGAANSRVDLVPAINNIDRNIGTGAGQQLHAPNDTAEGLLRPFRERLARVNPDDFEAVQRIRMDMSDAVDAAIGTNRGRLLRQALNHLDNSLEGASSGFRQANQNFAQRTRNIEAVDTGRAAAMRGRTEDTIPRFQALQPEGQQAFRSGYVDPLIAQTQGAAFGANKARPLINDAFQAEANVMAPGNPLMQRRIGREQTMFETRAAALGGSSTAKNLAHDTALGVTPHLIGQVLTGNMHGAVRSILAAGSNLMTGNTPAVRQQVANVLLRNGSNLAPGQLRDMVQNTVARIQFYQNIARNLGRGGAAGLAVEGPRQRRQG